MFDQISLDGSNTIEEKEKKPKNTYTRSEMVEDIKQLQESLRQLSTSLEEVKEHGKNKATILSLPESHPDIIRRSPYHKKLEYVSKSGEILVASDY